MKGNFMTDADIKEWYRGIDKGKDFGSVCAKLAHFDLFTIMDGDGLFTHSDQGDGVFMFTDYERAMNFMNRDRNASTRCHIGLIRLERALSLDLDMWINATPRGDNTLFFHWDCRNEISHTGMKDKDGHYTLPYGLTPSWQKRGLFGLKKRSTISRD